MDESLYNNFITDTVPMALEAIPISPTSINVTWTLSDAQGADSFELCYHAVNAQNSNGFKCFIM